MDDTNFDVIIVGGSYAGLSAAMALGRSLRRVLVIDNAQPCNAQTPHSHNFITHDGETPAALTERAKAQTLSYPTVSFTAGLAVAVSRKENHFFVSTLEQKTFQGRKVLFATGLRDIMPAIPGFAECWGISVLHCPYCHGYEVRNRPTGVLGDGDMGFELAKLIHHWTKRLTLFTNGPATLTAEQNARLKAHDIRIVEHELKQIEHDQGQVKALRMKNGEAVVLEAIYARPEFSQHCPIPEALGCELTPQKLLKVDSFHRTTVPGVYAAGDNSHPMRSVALAVSAGQFAGASINKDLIEEGF